MPVDTPAKAIADLIASWTRVEDVIAGSRVVKGKNTAYLPQTEAQKKATNAQNAYDAYLMRAVFEPVARRTKLAFEGMVFRVPPVVDGVDEALLSDVTLGGASFFAFARSVFGCVLSPGRCGVLVDAAPEGVVSASSRPYLREYRGVAVLDCREETVGELAKRLGGFADVGEFARLGLGEGSLVKAQVRLLEEAQIEDPNDRWMVCCVPQVRVIELAVVDGQIAQVHQLWREVVGEDGTPRKGEWVPFGEPVVPRRRGSVIPFIPLEVINPESIGVRPEEPPFLGLAELNLSHYQNSADLENARWKLGHPQAWATGVAKTDAAQVGDGMWTVESPQAAFGVLQVGDAFGSLERAMREKEEAMASEGARLLARPAGAPQRTATEALVDSVAERSLLATMAGTTSDGLQRVMAYLQWWAQGVGDLADVRERVSVRLNTDLEGRRLTASDAMAWAQVNVLGKLSDSTLRYQYRRGDVYPPGWTDEQEAAALAAQEKPEPGEGDGFDEDESAA